MFRDVVPVLIAYLGKKSVAIVALLERSIHKFLIGWTIAIILACGVRLFFPGTSTEGFRQGVELIFPYVLLAASPILAYYIASQVFRKGELLQQPAIRLSRYGRWRSLDCLTARQHGSFGATGLMASLLVGLLLNVPIRSLEFLLAVPAMNSSAPLWGQMIFATMTLDVVVMNFLYVVTFVMALRNVPWFPRMLLLVWCMDIMSQIVIANLVGHTPHLPQTVASAMAELLSGNMTKVLISVALWLPYLILSERVNVTYRSRVYAG